MKRKNVLVVGDSMIDITRTGTITRQSPEDRRCPVFSEDRRLREYALGGAANVARWMAADPALAVTLLTPYGHDADGLRMERLCKQSGIRLSTALCDPARGTTVKERLIVEDVQRGEVDHLCRIDWDVMDPPRAVDLAGARWEIEHPSYAAVVAVDYDKGTFLGENGFQLIGAMTRAQAWRVVNTKIVDRWKKAQVDVLACNQIEAKAGGFDMGHLEDALDTTAACCLIVTRGANGVTGVVTGYEPRIIHRDTLAQEVVDVCGAGDAFLTGFVQEGLRSGRSRAFTPNQMVDLLDAGQRSAAWCCSQVGVGTPLVPVD